MSESEAYYQRARGRAKRRKSPWNLILIPLSICGITGTAFLLGKGLLDFQQHFIPSGTIFAHYTRVGAVLMFVPIIFPSLSIGMMVANLIAWCIPPARKAFDKESKGIKGTSFTASMRTLAIVAALTLVLVAPICLLGSMNYFYITPAGIYLNPLLSIKEKHYGWDDIRKITIRCLAERRNLHLNYILHMNDGTKIDLLNEPRLKFAHVYDQIKAFLVTQKDIVYEYSVSARGIRRLIARYNTKHAEEILEVLMDRKQLSTSPR